MLNLMVRSALAAYGWHSSSLTFFGTRLSTDSDQDKVLHSVHLTPEVRGSREAGQIERHTLVDGKLVSYY